MSDAPYREDRISAQDGRQLYYRDYGDVLAPGRPLLCLPGLIRTCRDYHRLALRHAGTRRVLCPDYRGRGGSEFERDWRNYRLAEAVFDEGDGGKLRRAWDPKIARTIGQGLPDLWPYFRALRRLPLLAIRGALSSVLSAETFAAMAQEIPDMTQVTVPNVGHAPLLDEPEAEGTIDDFFKRCDG